MYTYGKGKWIFYSYESKYRIRVTRKKNNTGTVKRQDIKNRNLLLKNRRKSKKYYSDKEDTKDEFNIST